MNFLRVSTLKHQAAKSLNNENIFNHPKHSKKSMNKSTVCFAQTSRQFGKDISNYNGLTVSTNEVNNRKASDQIVKYSKHKRITKKNCLLQKLRNYNIKQKQKPSKSFIFPSNEIEKKHPAIITIPIQMPTEVITECNFVAMEVDDEKNMMTTYPNIKSNNDNRNNTRNIQQCNEYIDDIFEHLKEIEYDHLAKSNYMTKQNDINERMRGILLDWLIEVHLKFKLLPETMFLTVNIIDRFLEKVNINRTRLQLVGVAAMFIACKYEEIYSPEVKDFVYMTDKAYSKQEVLKMENDILAALEYNVTVPSSLRYLELYQNYISLSEVELMYCRYLIEMSLIDYKFLQYNPSLIAACSMLISIRLHFKDTDELFKLSGYTLNSLKICGRDMISIIERADISSLQAVRKKYLLPKFLEVSRIKINQFNIINQDLMSIA